MFTQARNTTAKLLLLYVFCTFALVRSQEKLEVGDRVPSTVIERNFSVCYQDKGSTTSLGKYDYTRNGGEKFVTVIATYYTGCTPGRNEAGAYVQVIDKYQTAFQRNVAAMETLKNGVNGEICEEWARLGFNTTDFEKISAGGFPVEIVDDQDRALLYTFFEGPEHPEYVILDPCMNVVSRVSNVTDLDTVLFEASSPEAMDTACSEQESSVSTPNSPPTIATQENPTCVAAFGTAHDLTTIANSEHNISFPRDVTFESDNMLWVANNHTDGITMLALNDDGTASSANFQADRAHYHYMDKISSLSFDSKGQFATCQ
ncbi:hypothetical protein CYMTET_52906, partial [Cymbomonas tetramitiformis]